MQPNITIPIGPRVKRYMAKISLHWQTKLPQVDYLWINTIGEIQMDKIGTGIVYFLHPTFNGGNTAVFFAAKGNGYYVQAGSIGSRVELLSKNFSGTDVDQLAGVIDIIVFE